MNLPARSFFVLLQALFSIGIVATFHRWEERAGIKDLITPWAMLAATVVTIASACVYYSAKKYSRCIVLTSVAGYIAILWADLELKPSQIPTAILYYVATQLAILALVTKQWGNEAKEPNA